MKRNCLLPLFLFVLAAACAGGGDLQAVELKWRWVSVVISVAASGLWLAKSVTAMFAENSEDDLVLNAVILGGLLLLNIYTLRENFSGLLTQTVGGTFSDALTRLGKPY